MPTTKGEVGALEAAPRPNVHAAARPTDSPGSAKSRLWWAAGVVSAGCITAYYSLWLARLPQMDFLVYRTGGRQVLHSSLYSSQITVLGRHLLFTYPPLSALLFWPFSHFSPHAGQVVWDLVDLAALVALITVSLAGARGRPVVRSDWRTAFVLVAPIGFLLWPVRYDLNLGQINIILVLMVVTDLTVGWSWRGRRLPKGVLVGLAAAIKLTPLVFVAWLVASRQWRAARNALVTFAVATGLLCVVAPRSSWLYFTKDAFDVHRVGNDQSVANQTLLAALDRAHLAPPSLVADLLVLGVLCGGVALATVAYRRSSAMLGMLVCAATGLLVSPISWQHHYVWVVPVLIWLAVGSDRPAQGGWWALAGAAAFCVIPPQTAGGGGLLPYCRANAYVLTALVFLGLVAAMLWVRSKKPESVAEGAAVLP